MADQGKWFKLWESALDDFDLENLSIHEWYCWARFGVYMKKHGREGKIRLRAPGTQLVNLFRTTSFQDAIDIVKRFPNYTVGDANSTVTGVTLSPVTYEVECSNWWKYQGDFSGDRVRKWRAEKRHDVTIQEEKRSRREQKRKEQKNITPVFTRPTILEISAFATSENLNIDASRFFNYYEGNGWKVGRNPMKDWKATARNWTPEGPNAYTRKPANAFVADKTESGKYD